MASWGVATWLMVSAARPAAASEVVDDLYRGEAIVTGRDNLEERDRGLREALTQVLVKVSGDPRLVKDPRLAPILDRAAAIASGLAYEDRLARKKLMDEQGTRERSFRLRVDFDPTRVDATLADLGARPWGAVRPTVLVLLAVRDPAGTYVLSGDGERGYGQRESLSSVARQRGLPVVLPQAGAVGTGIPSYAAIAAADPSMLETMRRGYRADDVLSGTMTLTADGTWDTTWRLLGGGEEAWRVDGTTFDRALAVGVDRTLLRLAGLP